MEMVDLNPSVGGIAKERKRCSSGGSSLPLDLLVEILSRLPAKTLCRFRCVSREWLRLLSSDLYFSFLHRRRSLWTLSNPPLLLLCTVNPSSDGGYALCLASFDASGCLQDDFCLQRTFATSLSVIPCLNLLCIKCSSGDIYVCNPSTRVLIQLPNSLNSGNVKPIFVAFGALRCAWHYKIFLFFETHCEVFSFVDGGRVRSGSWREIEKSPILVYGGWDAVCFDGFVCVMPDYETGENSSLLSLDLEREGELWDD